MEFNLIVDLSSVEHPSILKILSETCVAETISFLPENSIWINRLFVDLEKRNEKICLTLDCREINPNGPGRFRTQANNVEEKSCYFNNKAFRCFF